MPPATMRKGNVVMLLGHVGCDAKAAQQNCRRGELRMDAEETDGVIMASALTLEGPDDILFLHKISSHHRNVSRQATPFLRPERCQQA